MERPLRIAGTDAERIYKAAEIRKFRNEGQRDEHAAPIIKRVHPATTTPDPLHGLFATTIKGKPAVAEYELDPDLRDTEHIPLLEHGGIDSFIQREVLPYVPDPWYMPDSVKVGYEISFNRHFYKPQPMRSLAEIQADIIALERESEGLVEALMATSVVSNH